MKNLSYEIRELEINDFHFGFLDCLKNLTVVGEVTEEMFLKTFYERKRIGIMTIVAVDKQDSRILGTASMFYEPKFIRKCAVKAYIEDVCVSKSAQNMGIGKNLITYLQKKAINNNCYKIMLTCNHQNIDFYKKLNFKENESAMAIYN